MIVLLGMLLGILGCSRNNFLFLAIITVEKEKSFFLRAESTFAKLSPR